MTKPSYQAIINATDDDRLNLFLETAMRLGTPVQYIEKDFWVCWTLNELYNGLQGPRPRLLFKGCTSLSKAHSLINRFSEDIDITVFRSDLGSAISSRDLAALSGKKRGMELDRIRDACSDYIRRPLLAAMQARLATVLAERGQAGRVEVDAADPDGQTLLVVYPVVATETDGYIEPVVRIESGAKSALDPHHEVTIEPYIAPEANGFDLRVAGVVTVDAQRTFWDKVVILHGLRRWYDNRGELRNEGNRVSRHYYDLHCLMKAEMSAEAITNQALATDCVEHAKLFFGRPPNDLASATPGTYALVPTPAMLEALRGDYARMSAMIFGEIPTFEDVMASVERLEAILNEAAK